MKNNGILCNIISHKGSICDKKEVKTMESTEKIIDDLFEELTEEAELLADASCGGGMCGGCYHQSYGPSW